MSNIIENQSQQTINEVNFTVVEQQKAQKQQQERIQGIREAQNSQKIEKDIVLSLNSDQKSVRSKQQNGKPSLPSPKVQFSGLQKVDNGDQEIGLIALIGEVLAKQARTNSNIWSTLWKQAFNSMISQVKFAPLIGKAIEQAANAQAAATTADATQAEITGIISIGGFALTCGLTGASIYKEGLNMSTDENAAVNDAKTNPDEAELGGLKNASKDLNNGDIELSEMGDSVSNSQGQASRLEQDGNEVINEGKWKNSTKPALKAQQNAFQRGTAMIGEVAGKGANIGMGISSLTQGLTALTAQSPQGTAKALQQGYEGKFQALSKEGESYQQFFSQVVGRLDDLSRGSAQNIDYAMNVLKSASDSLTQANSQMFRG